MTLGHLGAERRSSQSRGLTEDRRGVEVEVVVMGTWARRGGLGQVGVGVGVGGGFLLINKTTFPWFSCILQIRRWTARAAPASRCRAARRCSSRWTTAPEKPAPSRRPPRRCDRTGRWPIHRKGSRRSEGTRQLFCLLFLPVSSQS